MNLPLTALVLGFANAALPPGYEDQIWCPPENCQIYTNPYRYAGALSNFYKCYSPTTDEITEGVWTGSDTDVVAPDVYIEPAMCTGSEYSQCDKDDDCSLDIAPSCNCYVDSSFHPFDPCHGLDASECNTDTCTGEECNDSEATCSSGSSGMGGTCEIQEMIQPIELEISARCISHDQCSARIRSKAPPSATGVDLCGCYASSSYDLFDECEGQDHCRQAKCSSEACNGVDAFCDVVSHGAIGECKLREIQEPIQPIELEISARCISHDQCSARIRSKAPPSATGVDLCGCYASSSYDLFDECEGQDHCRQAKCSSEACNGVDAFCDVVSHGAIGECKLKTASGDGMSQIF